MPTPKHILKRLQHEGFGAELRGLICSKKGEDREAAGIIVDEIMALTEAKQRGGSHPKEDRLSGDDLSDIGYLRLYVEGRSIRIYFMITKGVMLMLALNADKRATSLDEGMKKRLRSRRRDGLRLVAKLAAESAANKRE